MTRPASRPTSSFRLAFPVGVEFLVDVVEGVPDVDGTVLVDMVKDAGLGVRHAS